MIKIERINADKPTLLRNNVRQPVTLSMVVTQAELDSIEASSGSIIYSVDETQVKELTFQPAIAAAKPVVKQPAARVAKPAPTPAQPVMATPSAETAPE